MRYLQIVTWWGDAAAHTMTVALREGGGEGSLDDALRALIAHPTLTEAEGARLALFVYDPAYSVESIVRARLPAALAPCGHADCRASLGEGLEMARACAAAREPSVHVTWKVRR